LAYSSSEDPFPDAPHEDSPGAVPSGASRELTCSVVVCTRNRPEWLEKCLQAASRLDYPHFDLVVVDSAPEDSRAHEIAQRFGARYLCEPRPGASRARNCGVRACDTEVVAFLDDDAQPEPDWLSALAVEFQDPQVMAVSGRVLSLGVETEAERIFERMGGFDAGEQRWELNCEHPLWFVLANFGGLGNEANMAFRRRAFDLWPGFDERLGPGTTIGTGGEGPYALFSLIDRGHRIVYTPDAVVRHPYPRTMPDLRARHRGSLSNATAYMALLLVEEPRYRWAVIRYVAEAVRGKRRAWRPPLPGTQPYPRMIPRWRAGLAMLVGPALYFWARVTRRAHTH
jgi:O-antigen biosynthesis protein